MNKTAAYRLEAMFALGLACWAATACGESASGSEINAGAPSGTGAAAGDDSSSGSGSGPDIDVSGGADGVGGADSGMGAAGAPCGATKLLAAPPEVNVLLVVDKSGSMDNTPPGFDTDKWAALRAALQATFEQTGSKISFGLDLYPHSGTGEPLTDVCQMPTGAAVVVPIQPGTQAAPEILSALEDNPPDGGTPTAAALSRALAYFSEGAGKDLTGEKYVLLATDGGPNCNAQLSCPAASCTVNLDKLCPTDLNCCDPELDPDGPSKCLDEADSVAAVEALAENGIKTIVIGIPGTEDYKDTLDALAAKSGVVNPDAPPQYFAVSAEGGVAGLSDVLERVTTGLITSCRLQLEETPPEQKELFVVIDGELIEQGGEDGWDVVEGTSPPVIEILGQTCAKLEADGAERITITYDCPITDPH